MSFKDIVLGFTGTKLGMSSIQHEGIIRYIDKYRDRIESGHHGDCIGADAEFHAICVRFSIPLEVHPPSNDSWRAFCSDGVRKIHEPKDYGVRDRDIVNACNVLLATPQTAVERLRSGTWWTVRIARRAKHNPLIIILAPDRRVENF